LNKDVINFNELRFKKILNTLGSLREFDDRYEFCLIDKYEEKFNTFNLDSIQIADTYVQMLEHKKRLFVVSYEFLKANFNLKDILNWLHKYKIDIVEKQNNEQDYYITAESIVSALKFRGNPIVLYVKGSKRLKIDRDLNEITDYFIPTTQKVDTGESKEIESINQILRIILDGKEIDYIPRIEFDLTKDILISNGNIIVAKYIDDYMGSVGFYYDDPSLPVAWLHDKNAKVFINIYEKDSRKIVVVESKYVFEILF